MMITVDFCEMEEVGELQPPRITSIKTEYLYLPSVPRFKDQIDWKDRRYFVYDVIYKERFDGEWGVYITACYSDKRRSVNPEVGERIS